MPAPGPRYLAVVADDFGISRPVNEAIAEAHDNGVLTCASLMAGAGAFDDAVRKSGCRKGLSVGLHLTLCDGRAVLPPSMIPDLCDRDNFFQKSPELAWIRYTRPRLKGQIELEIAAQLDRLARAGIDITHIDGHHHLHMHPVVFRILCEQAGKRGIRRLRILNEPLGLALRAENAPRALLEWSVFKTLGAFNSIRASKSGLVSAKKVFGLSGTGRVDENYLLRLLELAGVSCEVFTHPDLSTPAGRTEARALTSGRVRNKMESLGITLTGYRELRCLEKNNPEPELK